MCQSESSPSTPLVRKIIHLDMDCFFAAIEERDDPSLRGQPLAVAGSGRRAVLTTANYEARRYGCRSAMPVFQALERCPDLRIVPVRFERYQAESARIRAIFARFTNWIEPLSLDEAYLDVSHLRSDAAAVAREIRAQIREETGLTGSAGISSNKMIAKIASDINKPNGQFEVKHGDIPAFVAPLPVGRLWGVGSKMAAKLAALGVATCADLQWFERADLARRFGKWGLELWELCRGIDERPVTPHRERKSLSSETTFAANITTLPGLLGPLGGMIEGLREDLAQDHPDRVIRGLVVKLKFSDFGRTTAERAWPTLDAAVFRELLAEAWKRGAGKPVRLLGVGVRFQPPSDAAPRQLEFFG
ncbi:MAG: DNA polymerase IV [Akkermansiaceae bacterium]|jgi:DNA polymerase-4|nr:DNA polymerase IV [Akkermansiaceae bacterium]